MFAYNDLAQSNRFVLNSKDDIANSVSILYKPKKRLQTIKRCNNTNQNNITKNVPDKDVTTATLSKSNSKKNLLPKYKKLLFKYKNN